MNARLVAVRPEADDISSFVFEPEEPVERQAGQFVRYVLPHPQTDERGNDRYFTIASAPFEQYLQITTRLAPQSSSFKQALQNLPIGSVVQIDEPEGEFVVNDDTRNYIFVVGGIGITPVRSILAELHHSGVHIKAHVLYGTNDKQVLFKAELDDFVRANPNLVIEYIASSTSDMEQAVQRAIRETDEPYVYLSGPEPMVEKFAIIVKKLGLKIGHIQTDFFSGYDEQL